MKRILSKSIKKVFVLLNLDRYIADIYHRSRFGLIRKLIPDRTFFTPDDRRTVKRYNVKFSVRPADFTQWRIYADKDFSHVYAALKVLNKVTNIKDGIILDIGANRGHFSLVLGKYIQKNNWSFKVIAFEPNPKVFNDYNINLDLNPELKGIVSIFNLAVGDENSVLQLQVPFRNSGAGSLVRSYDNEQSEKIEVEVVPIDKFLSDNSAPVLFMKIDVENFEYFVLKGAKRILEKDKPGLFMEMGEGQIKGIEILQILKSLNYKLYKSIGKEFIAIEENEPLNKIGDILAI